MAPTIEQDEREDVEGQEAEDVTTDAQDGAEGQDEPALREDGKPVTAADWAALREALTKARKDARTAKRTAKGGSGTATGGAGSEEGAPNVDEIRRESETAAEAKWKPTVVRTAARAAFAEAGLVSGKSGDAAMKRAIRLLDLADLDVDEDGNVEGLEEQIDEIKADFPELFAARRNGRPGGGVDGADKSDRASNKVKSSAQTITDQLFGKR
jgi:hypothetical protein